jgi:hypothetical protein
MDIAQALLSAGADPNLKGQELLPSLKKKGVTALMAASMHGNADLARQLIAKGAKVNQQDDEGQTALILAAREGNAEVAKVLISNKADTEIRDKFGRTPLIVATIFGHTSVVRVLLLGGANLRGRDINHLTAYSYARSMDRNDIMQLLNYAGRRNARRY